MVDKSGGAAPACRNCTKPMLFLYRNSRLSLQKRRDTFLYILRGFLIVR